ncbi:MAG TPA: glycosyltransferase family 9 protein [Noviherbaspirillum sp.]|nr:glycosyltransferase family 9 protein [Noviherbaspirillum sp.]
MEQEYAGEQEEGGAGVLRRSRIETLAIFRALQLGDMLCAVPALRALRAALPDTRITLIGLPWAEQFASRYRSYIDDFIAFPGHPDLPEQPVQHERLDDFALAVRERHFDLALQLHGSGEISNRIVSTFGAKACAGYKPKGMPGSSLHYLDFEEGGHESLRLLRLVAFLGAPMQGEHLEFPLFAQDDAELRDSGVARTLVERSYFCIHPGARMRDKCWPLARFAEVADRLCDEFRLQAVITGSGQERDLAEALAAQMRNRPVIAAAPISIGAMAALMSRSRLLICNDTGVSHIAAGLRLPSVVIFSKSDMERWAPLDAELHRCVWDPEGQQGAAVLAHARVLLR